jgi:two-component system phosphate regulon sensor histidine kinase PhoR
MEAGRDSLVYASDRGSPDELVASGFKTRLFPLDLAPPHYDIALHFPGEQAYMVGQIWPFWLASIVFMSVIVASFVRTLRANAAQRRYAEHLVDFVNNMTHEFKTPISTVSLASEALSRNDIAEHPEALRRYNAMIRDENRRMGEQVEKILQIAQLESGDFELNRSVVDLNEIAAGVIQAFSLPVERHHGVLTFRSDTESARVSGDEVHLTSVIGNLVDNAVKYADGAPEITVSTRSDGEGVVLEVADRGPGVADSDLGQVFEKYYRGHTGNRHDVKGFGLGLSYVKLVVEAHGGRVRLAARPGGGTVATVHLPRLPDPPDTTGEATS